MTPIDLDDVDRVCAMATEGPWVLDGSVFQGERFTMVRCEERGVMLHGYVGTAMPTMSLVRDDLAFVAMSREAVPTLSAELRAARARVADLEAEVERLRAKPCPHDLATAFLKGGDQ